MSWNEPGGNKKDPWGDRNNSGPGGGGDKQQPPDLDEVYRKVQAQLRKIFGGGGQGDGGGQQGSGSGGIAGIVVIAVVIVALVAAFNSFTIIDDAERGVVLRFGAFDRIHQPGLRFHIPFVEEVRTVNVTGVRSVTNRGTMLTRDENLVNVEVAVQYRIRDPEDFLFQVQQADSSMQGATEAAMREIIGNNDMDYILGDGRAEVSQVTDLLLQGILDQYLIGIEVVSVNLRDARPPDEVRAAFDDAIRAREDQQRFENEAEAYARGVVPDARGRAARITEEAQGYRASVIADAEGQARRFNLLLEQYAQQPEVMRERLYIEALEGVMQRTPKVLVNSGEGNNNLMYLPLDQLMSKRGSDVETAWAVPQPPESDVPSGAISPADRRRDADARRDRRR